MPIPIENFFSFAKADSNKLLTDCRPFFKLHRVQFTPTSGCAWDSSRAKSSLNVYDQEANDACGAHDRIKDTQPPWSRVKWRPIAPSWQFRCQLHANIHLTWTCRLRRHNAAPRTTMWDTTLFASVRRMTADLATRRVLYGVLTGLQPPATKRRYDAINKQVQFTSRHIHTTP